MKTTDVMTVTQAANRLGVCKRTVYRLIQRGTIKAEKPKRHWLIERANLDNYKSTVAGKSKHDSTRGKESRPLALTLERKARRNWNRAVSVYKLVNPAHLEAIKATGLRSDSREIFVFTDLRYTLDIAASIGLFEFSILAIDKAAFDGLEIKWDWCGERYTVCSFYCVAESIPPSFIKVILERGVVR